MTKYFATAISIILLAGVVWMIFFSGIVLHKEVKKDVTDSISNSTKNTAVVLETNYGNIEIALDKAAAPQTSANFEKLVKDGFYNNLTFHRIIPGFVIQGGDPQGDGTGGPGYTVPAEIKLLHKRGSIATARLGDQANPSRASSGSQFYIALQDLPMLDGQYTVFGQVTAGMDVVDKIAAVETDASDKPTNPVIINKAFIK
ncbi:MAG: hypothetical protein A2751_00890 [Candidatus Doudnabacteria bacterium RIFCSPHIGHO2_01_FULL_46_14]|uniref:Peptidyl-prolyl cis-trans isomerase n=1 Tax=Candidatus Doudnabacteria bacterium RIFCSPHIGHO2_01_FULL_46_14 TaxID=1817824 RepID=A0A1F5NMU2_9BACT|nr:MAG: hypothetical protein A2751_00890 [Candidatus Doudnabacteria bacterium RIFCSPHIGHO2_01_FULL_46_14]